MRSYAALYFKLSLFHIYSVFGWNSDAVSPVSIWPAYALGVVLGLGVLVTAAVGVSIFQRRLPQDPILLNEEIMPCSALQPVLLRVPSTDAFQVFACSSGPGMKTGHPFGLHWQNGDRDLSGEFCSSQQHAALVRAARTVQLRWLRRKGRLAHWAQPRELRRRTLAAIKIQRFVRMCATCTHPTQLERDRRLLDEARRKRLAKFRRRPKSPEVAHPLVPPEAALAPAALLLSSQEY
eukprot:TRINITY_DN6365_c0_g1_i2.p1 TRINITY_DN6365_c0_g1~~TRINITY_DN6365_c0_g1_i2.p1  ORF type:complete len:236 (+),score=8.42 TRINITY_DN6365_c0_g1_i2:139-846(+)